MSLENKDCDTLNHDINLNFFTFRPCLPSGNKKSAWAKAFLFPDQPFIAAFSEKQFLTIGFESHTPGLIHPDQAEVEIYNSITPDKKDALLELEYHSAYKQLKPGESMEAWEYWEIKAYPGEVNDTSCISFILKGNLNDLSRKERKDSSTPE